MQAQPPAILYKYVPIKIAKLILICRTRRWSNPLTFNDPSEFSRVPRFDPPLNESVELYANKLFAHINGAEFIDENRLSDKSKLLMQGLRFLLERGMSQEAIINEIIRPYAQDEIDSLNNSEQRFKNDILKPLVANARVLCLTNNPENTAMWDVYGDNHNGCVLGFRHIPKLDTPLQKARKIDYCRKPAVICSGVDFMLYSNSREIEEKIYNGFCFTKRVEYSYEEEWRVVTHEKNNIESKYTDYPFHPEELESLTFGLRTSAPDRFSLFRLAKDQYPRFEIHQIKKQDGDILRVRADPARMPWQ